MSEQTIIIGAGLAGLSAAYHSDSRPLVFEKEATPGGKARSVTTESGAVFDFTGHLLHLRKPEMIALVERLLPDALERIERRAAIFMEDRFLPYPFQANFHPLSRSTVKECLLGFIQAWAARQQEPESQDFDSFADWALATFGPGICNHFLFPYNEKLYCTSPEEMSAEWVSWSVPQPDLEAVIDGALGSVQEGLGYNAHFLYPNRGGIELLPRALADAVEGIRYETEIHSIDPVARKVTDNEGNSYGYDRLISTMPLPALADRIEGLNPELKAAARNLRYVNVYNLNLVIRNRPDWDWQWLYLPEKEFRCYRIGVSSNITRQLAPPGRATVYTEVSYLPGQRPDPATTRQEVITDLQSIGLVSSSEDILETVPIDLECAYVVHNHHRAEWLPRIHAWLREHQIISTGRWGEWVYGGMEDAMWQGHQAVTG